MSQTQSMGAPANLKEGRFPARLVLWGIGTTKDGLPQIVVNVKVMFSANEVKDMTWFGSLKTDKSEEITREGLHAFGWDGSFDSIAGGRGLDRNIVGEAVIKVEQDGQGYWRQKVSYLQKPGGGMIMQPMEAITLLKKHLADRQKQKEQQQNAFGAGSDAASGFTANDIPF